MRKAMADAPVGDDWYGDDPTVNLLQERSAEVTGKEAAVYLATGTMANQIAMHIFGRSGHVIVCEATAHVRSVESTSSAVLSGLSFVGLPAARGQLTAEMVSDALEPDPYDVEVVDLVAVENTHQIGGGTVMPVDELRAIRKMTGDSGVPLYLDGARIFNASAASGVPVAEYGAEVDAMMFSLSKGLGAPIGSVLCGTADLIEEARRVKILIGGAWRQAGIVAAAGLIGLAEGPKRLHEDHANARRLAEGLAEATPECLDPSGPETNIVFVDVRAIGAPPLEAMERLRAEGILVTIVAGKLRMLTHLDVTAEDVEQTIGAWRRVAPEIRRDRQAG
jgi:threonine aldolase